MGGIVLYLDVEHGGESAQALGSDAEGIDFVVEFETKFFGAIAGASSFQLLEVDGFHDGFFGEQHRFFVP